jgi:hypothetical protein
MGEKDEKATLQCGLFSLVRYEHLDRGTFPEQKQPPAFLFVYCIRWLSFPLWKAYDKPNVTTFLV